MDPWATSMEFMDDMGAIMRNSILCAIGTVSGMSNGDGNVLNKIKPYKE